MGEKGCPQREPMTGMVARYHKNNNNKQNKKQNKKENKKKKKWKTKVAILKINLSLTDSQ